MKKENRLIVDEEPQVETVMAPTLTATGDAQPTRRKRRAKPSMTGDYPGMRRVTGYVEPSLFRWLKSISAETDKPMIQIFEEALTDYVQSYAAGRKFGG